MCGCDGFYVCPRCAGTPADPLYVDDEPREPLPERDERTEGLLIGVSLGLRLGFMLTGHSGDYLRIAGGW